MKEISSSQKILSVSVAAYNVAATLREALDPFTQPHISPYVEVLIIDDGSGDETAAIALEYQNRFPSTFRLISKENGGWGSTLNAGMQYASGKYFKQLDGDDHYSVENMPAFLDFLDKCDADMVCTAFAFYEDLTGGILSVESRIREFVGIYETLKIKELGDFLPAMHALAVKTQLVKDAQIKITEKCFYTDVEFVIKVYNICETFAYMELPVYLYRIGMEGQSMSLSGIRKHYKDHQIMLFNTIDYYENCVIDDYKKNNIRKRLEKACSQQYWFYLALEGTKQQKKELMEFDLILKEKYPDFYEYTSQSSRINLLRKTQFRIFRPLGRFSTKSDKKHRRNIFEGN